MGEALTAAELAKQAKPLVCLLEHDAAHVRDAALAAFRSLGEQTHAEHAHGSTASWRSRRLS